MITDTHCHLYKEYYDDMDGLINLCFKIGVDRFINNACDIDSMKEVLALTQKYPNIYCALGIHPENVEMYSLSDIEFLVDNLNHDKVVAIGEIGLDYHYTKENKENQIELFEMQLKIAEKYKLPVIVHSREATLDTINCLKKFKVKGVIHCFTGSYETALEYIKMGFLLGVNGVITYKNSNVKEVYQKIDLKNIVLETDSPYLSPVPYRGKQNNPSHIKEIAFFLSDLHNISVEELVKITNLNIKRIFDI